ncbi:raftlin [Dipodomys spectabilis]|uniref:raftlin n=1 Tax=Dipodomys spectabilis TaxID=105255 RepID=UPI001C54740E|nr:raftlin [Dipodomys spectabilis]XP_042536023.1 raftlin [Dipodomys spectabilis]XP_042536024.1 raftlin [Dipodomys spectabilis]XP_042536025.1 raftlin [Dipodomys spectabilis]XP_042536026.1 raftlin [Dipodomys spectabilis]
MGCGLNKLEKRDEKRPGNIYSTLKRPQVETKVDVSYEYRFLEFTTLSAAELPRSSAVRLTSLRDLPTQLLELYQQGFSLAALHPFVQPTHTREKIPLEHIFRAILVKKTDRSQKTDLHNEGYILELDCCSSLDHQKLIPDFVKKVQDAASRGLKFVGVIPQYHAPAKSVGSSLPTPPARDAENTCGNPAALENEDLGTADMDIAPARLDGSPEPSLGPMEKASHAQHSSSPLGEGEGGDFSLQGSSLEGPEGDPSDGPSGKMEIFALFNRPKSHPKCRQYYPVTIPLRVSKNGQAGSSLDANWLEHMSDHFRKGGMLVNAVFHLAMANDSLHGLTDGVFIFEAVSTEDSKTIQGYDAIVVEQWTVLEGAEVQTDYVPLLNSLAAYGWQLTCVLPTPVVKTTREGSVSTKQIVFLQRPCLPQKIKKKESKFQWRFSRDEMHSRQMRKSKGKFRDKRHTEENEKNLEDQFSKGGDMGNCVSGRQREGGACELMTGPVPEARGEGQGGGTVQNGPAGHSRAPAAPQCSDPTEEAEVTAELAPVEGN